MTSVIGRPWPEDGDVGAWLQPYRDTGADPALARAFTARSRSFRRERSDARSSSTSSATATPCPGADAINERFGTPHDGRTS